jgi:hypothetical protein
MKTVNLVLFILYVLAVLGNAENLGENTIYDISWFFEIFVAGVFFANYKKFKQLGK